MRSQADPKRAVKSPIPTLIGVLLGLLLLSSSLFILDRQENRFLPSASNSRSTGLSALADLLRDLGFKVRIDASFRPSVPEGALGIRPLRRELWLGSNTGAVTSVGRTVNRIVEQGGTVLEIGVDGRLATDGENFENLGPVQVSNGVTSEDLKMTIKVGTNSLDAFGGQPGVPMLTVEGATGVSQLVGLSQQGLGTRAMLYEGSFLLNRQLDQLDHARVALTIIRALAPGTKEIVFIEGDLVNAEPSLWQEIGPWANALYWQAVFLVLVIAYTLGKRFGPPIEDVVTVRGSRELLEAFGDLMRRAKRSNLALELLYGNLDLRVRRAINLPTMAEEKDRNVRISPELVVALTELRNASREDSGLKNAAGLARRALALVEDLERTARTRRAGL